jgi:hypothetical protein
MRLTFAPRQAVRVESVRLATCRVRASMVPSWGKRLSSYMPETASLQLYLAFHTGATMEMSKEIAVKRRISAPSLPLGVPFALAWFS